MKKTNLPYILLFSMLLLIACKKKDETEPEPAPVVPVDTYTPPPAGGGFYFVNRNSQEFSWTQDFITFKKYSSKIQFADCFGFANDTLLVYHNDKVTFGNVYNPADFKTVTCSKDLVYLSWINGVIVCYTSNNTGRYLGSCDFKNGESSITFTLQPTSIYFGPLQHVGHAVVSVGSENGNSVLARTTNGKSWWYSSTPPSFSGGTLYIKKYNGVMYAYNSSGFIFSTTDTSFASTSWTNPTFTLNQNTTDTVGYFQSSFLRRQGNGWISYGYVYSTQSGNQLPAKNVSTDNGTTYSTSFLKGIPNNKPYTYALSKTHSMVNFYDNSVNDFVLYISPDFLNHTAYPGNNSTFNSGMFTEFSYFE